MSTTLFEFADWLAERDLRWPNPPALEAANATPYLKKLPGIRAVTWDVYGTLLRITDGELLFDPPKKFHMQIALEKTIEEFNMWQSMVRKPGPPWEQLYDQYKRGLQQQQMSATRRKGDVREVDATQIWRRIVDQLRKKEYVYDESLYGNLDELSEKIAFFFHANLQGIEAQPHAADAIDAVHQTGLLQTLLADAQSFTLCQLVRALSAGGAASFSLDRLTLDCMTLSYREEVKKPSPNLYRRCLERLSRHGIEPNEVLHIGSRLRKDLAIAKQLGMRTALFAGDKISLDADKEDVRDPKMRPDRLLTELGQIREIL